MTAFILPFEDKYLADAFGVMTPERRRMGLGSHRGTDWNGLKAGTPVRAVADGIIVRAYYSQGLGNVVILKTLAPWKDNPARALYFGYAHLNAPTTLPIGTAVKAGDVIGAIGNTGSFSGGDHLHLTLGLAPDSIHYGFTTDPHAYLVRRGAKALTAKPKAKPKGKK